MRLVLSALVVCLSLACGTTRQGSPPAANQLTTTVQQLHEGQVVDGVPCQHDDLPAQHFHVHLEVLLAGRLSRYPPASGSEGRGGRTRTGSSRRGAASPGSILTTRPAWCTCSPNGASHIRRFKYGPRHHMGVQVPLMRDKRPSADVCHYFG